MARLDALANCSSEPDALTRLPFTPAHRAAIGMVEGWMREAGMAVSVDPLGNVVGRYAAGRPDARTLLLGSHIDSVRNAGRYDGPLGVAVAIAAVGALHQAGERLDFAIEVLAFCDEEGVRFPVALTGSRAVAGTLDPAALDATDIDGVSVAQALREFGCDPAQATHIGRARAEVLAYVEVHIEQGPVLEAHGLPAGIVSAINGATRGEVTIDGMGGHAGNVPMPGRRDALCAAAEMVLEVERTGLATPGLVATVGRIAAAPGAVNVIPGSVRFTLDMRSPDDAVRANALAGLVKSFTATATRRGVSVALRTGYDQAAVACDPGLMRQLAASLRRTGIRPLELSSGAGHDGLAIAALCPIGMLFVRCAGGISHHPAESVLTEDVDIAVRVLLDFLRHFEAG